MRCASQISDHIPSVGVMFYGANKGTWWWWRKVIIRREEKLYFNAFAFSRKYSAFPWGTLHWLNFCDEIINMRWVEKLHFIASAGKFLRGTQTFCETTQMIWRQKQIFCEWTQSFRENARFFWENAKMLVVKADVLWYFYERMQISSGERNTFASECKSIQIFFPPISYYFLTMSQYLNM